MCHLQQLVNFSWISSGSLVTQLQSTCSWIKSDPCLIAELIVNIRLELKTSLMTLSTYPSFSVNPLDVHLLKSHSSLLCGHRAGIFVSLLKVCLSCSLRTWLSSLLGPRAPIRLWTALAVAMATSCSRNDHMLLDGSDCRRTNCLIGLRNRGRRKEKKKKKKKKQKNRRQIFFCGWQNKLEDFRGASAVPPNTERPLYFSAMLPSKHTHR